ncbi:hypothetical protein Lesp02_57100 [Lentzea sp. NBRC 105346]|uniref:tetratricopeptide repeat protein n=1 Tax=Lentzea sp. NBRC 105346 TaxID=3032205 RepID=UPI0024A5E1C1|nr:tetratricopeptide repeat protein [Lentzea sp. NBRC 105346]GLZ33522.1 hypothetical protein Lesp02_57100 [Lentzea sp. NBRC 105346]
MKHRFAREFDELLGRSPWSVKKITSVARRHGIGYSTLQTWRTGEHLPRAPDDNPGFCAFLGEVAADPAEARRVLDLATSAWRESVRLKKSRFVGRIEYQQVLGAYLKPSDTPKIVVIWGAGGIGKTALARQIVRDAVTVDLRGSGTDPLSVRQALAELLESFAPGLSGGVEVLRATYQHLVSARPAVLLLDDACDAAQVLPLLPSSPACVTVVTSRDPLQELESRGALRVRLGPLRPAESRQLLSSVNAPVSSLDELAALCGHEPLALRIAAGQLAGSDGPALARYVGALRGGRATHVELAYRDLPADAQELFRLAGQSPGVDFTVDALAALIGKPLTETERLLTHLVAVNLVDRRVPGRFGLHDKLRLFAQERGGDGGAASRRLAAYYATGAFMAARRIFPEMLTLVEMPVVAAPSFDTDQQASAWLAAERVNIVATASAAPGLWLANALRAVQQVRPHGIDWTPVALAALSSAACVRDRAAMHLAAGLAHWGIGKLEAAAGHLSDAVRLYRDLRKPRERAVALLALGAVAHVLGLADDACGYLTESLRLRRRFGERRGESSVLIFLADVRADLGAFAQAQQHASVALELAEETGYTAGVVGALGILGRVCVALGDTSRAASHFQRQLDLATDLEFGSRKAIALVGLATVACANRHYEQAIEQATSAVSIASDSGNTATRCDALNVIGAAHLGRGRPAAAVSFHRQALEASELAGYLRGRAEALAVLDSLESSRGLGAAAPGDH